ncbi:hypothetical protein NX059_000854 [Plenodomus lindquistii]|nr:hypothetical protein NX059_000854 [Plenodomus lindquistii]
MPTSFLQWLRLQKRTALPTPPPPAPTSATRSPDISDSPAAPESESSSSTSKCTRNHVLSASPIARPTGPSLEESPRRLPGRSLSTAPQATQEQQSPKDENGQVEHEEPELTGAQVTEQEPLERRDPCSAGGVPKRENPELVTESWDSGIVNWTSSFVRAITVDPPQKKHDDEVTREDK